MTIFKSKTLEGYIGRSLAAIGLLIAVLVFLLVKDDNWNNWTLALFITVTLVLYSIFAVRFKQRLMNTLDRALLHIEAVKVEDYSQYAKSDFEQGLSHDVHSALKSLSNHLQNQKSRYDQHAFLLYQLIDQLNTPMMVFNNKLKLTYANAAFSLLYNEPWQMYRQASPKLLGLVQDKGEWQLTRQQQKWQISQSEFIDSGEAHLLLVFTNIDSAVRASQLNAWQQIIRVMSHEIRNSLTPVSSLAESLSSRVKGEREQQALAMISERCHHLQDFVSRYSSLSQKLNLNQEFIKVSSITQKLQVLNPNVEFDLQIEIEEFWADKTFLEQVLINLCKNAVEANADKLIIQFNQNKSDYQINIIDNGHGFANPDNLFVPLFSTKPEGQGIGLSFCRNIIEQHNGQIDIFNNPPEINRGKGVSVEISLPKRIH